MELIEMELIKKLQNTQAIQKQAYQDLEAAIQQRSTLGKDMMGSSGYRSQSNGMGMGNAGGQEMRQSHDMDGAQNAAMEWERPIKSSEAICPPGHRFNWETKSKREI